jgi:hypothetical protein
MWVRTNGEVLGRMLQDGFEIKKYILTQKEHEYLNAVIKPFRKDRDIIFIKCGCGRECEFIHIELQHEYFGGERMELPYFAKGTMYKGMTPGKKYTLEELGL